MRRGIVIGLGLVLLAGAAGGLWQWQRAQAGAGAAQAAKPADGAASAPRLEFRAAEVVQPERASLPERIRFSGPLVAPDTAVLRARATGTLLSLAVAEGDRVRAGQVLGQIDIAELAPRIAERNAQIDAARASLAQAERSHADNQRLAAQGFISPSALENSRMQLDSARASVAAARATLDTTRAAGRDAMLVAPIQGIVARRHVLPGEKLSADQQVLTIVNLGRIELAATVGTHEVGRLAADMPVQVQVEGVDTPITAKLLRIAPAAEPGTRAIGVTVGLPNPGERLRAGQYAVAEVLLPDATQRLLLPAAAVASSGGQHHVWLIEQGRLTRRSITLGRRDEAGGRVEVLDGLRDGAQVLGARFDNLREGQQAQVLPQKQSALALGQAAAGTPALR